MQRIANAHAAAVVDGNPRRAGCGVQQSVEHWPVGHCVTAVFHALGLAEGRRDRTAVQMIASDYGRSFDLFLFHQIVHRDAELAALTVSQPADTSRQSLELDALAG